MVSKYDCNHADDVNSSNMSCRPYFEKLVRTCFQHFGDRVKHWSTINEMWTYAVKGYAYGSMAPCRCSTVSGNTCTAGDSRVEPYEVVHNLLLAHAKAYQLYKNNYKVLISYLVFGHYDKLQSQPTNSSLFLSNMHTHTHTHTHTHATLRETLLFHPYQISILYTFRTISKAYVGSTHAILGPSLTVIRKKINLPLNDIWNPFWAGDWTLQ